MTKSPRAVAREALALAREALPAYTSARSRKDSTAHQLFAVLALKTFFKTDYRQSRRNHRTDSGGQVYKWVAH